MGELIKFVLELWKDKAHRSLYLFTTIITVLLIGGFYELGAKPMLETMNKLQETKFEILIGKIDELNSKFDRLEERQWESRK